MAVTQSIPIGMPVVMTQNVVYALPATQVMVQASAAVDVSSDGTTWSALTGANTVGANTAAAFIRCTTTNPTVTLKAQ